MAPFASEDDAVDIDSCPRGKKSETEELRGATHLMRTETGERFSAIGLGRLHVVLLQLAVERGLADPQQSRGRKFVAAGFA